MIIKKEFTIDLAHRLNKHEGKCFNVHGHTYKIILHVKGSINIDGPEEGMVIDFGRLKYIIDRFQENRDHAYLYKTGSDPVGEFIKDQGLRVFETDFELTAENMCKFILKKFDSLHGVEVYETPTSSALLFKD